MSETLLRAFLALAIGTATLAASLDALSTLHSAGVQTLAEVQARNDSQTLRAAHIAFQLNGGHANATEAELIAAKYLEPGWTAREIVDTAPLVLPSELLDEPAQ